MLVEAYRSATFALFHDQAAVLYARVLQAFERYQFRWMDIIEPYRALELVQRGRHEDARTFIASVAAVESGSERQVGLMAAEVMLEARAGSPERALALLAAAPRLAPGSVEAAPVDLARLEMAALGTDAELAPVAADLYTRLEARRFARIAGVAAVALARAGQGAPATPGWLAGDSPLRVLWAWAEGIADRNAAVLHEIAARLEAIGCPYEAALALRDAGDLAAAYRAFRDLGATTAREQTAALLRAAGQPIPRRSREAVQQDGLTETERIVLRLMVSGETNDAIAVRLNIGMRTVEAHLTRLYQKTGQRGRAALAAWWMAHESNAANARAVASVHLQVDF